VTMKQKEEDVFTPYLRDDEQILWRRGPEQKFLRTENTGIVFMGVMFCIVMFMVIVNQGEWGWLFCLVPLIAGYSFFGMFGDLRMDIENKNAYYAVTTQRVLIIKMRIEVHAQKLSIINLPMVKVGRGKVEFNNPQPKKTRNEYSNRQRYMGFYGIPDAPEVAQLITERKIALLNERNDR